MNAIMNSSDIYAIAASGYRYAYHCRDHCPGAAPHELWATAMGPTCIALIKNYNIFGVSPL